MAYTGHDSGINSPQFGRNSRDFDSRPANKFVHEEMQRAGTGGRDGLRPGNRQSGIAGGAGFGLGATYHRMVENQQGYEKVVKT